MTTFSGRGSSFAGHQPFCRRRTLLVVKEMGKRIEFGLYRPRKAARKMRVDLLSGGDEGTRGREMVVKNYGCHQLSTRFFVA